MLLLFATGNAMDWVVFCLFILPFLLLLTPWWHALNYGLRQWKTGDGTVWNMKETWCDNENIVLDGDVVDIPARMFYSFRLKSTEGWEDTVWVKEDVFNALGEGNPVRFRYRVGRFHGKREIVPTP